MLELAWRKCLAISQPDLPIPRRMSVTLELGWIRVERRQSLFGVINGYNFETRFLQRRLNVKQDERLILNDQNRTAPRRQWPYYRA